MIMEKNGGSPVGSATSQLWSPVDGGQLSLVRLKKNSKLWREREKEREEFCSERRRDDESAKPSTAR
jgi:hypothetical protein